MALMIYSNGIIEENAPIENTFTDEELIQTFDDHTIIRTHRLPEVPNCWCIWGEIENPAENEFNKLGSEIVDDDVFSHVLFVHDSEINIDWNLTDRILFRSYGEFMKNLGEYINEMVSHIATENMQEIQEADHSASMIFLTAIGHTADKRVLFSFNPNEQNENFYEDGGWQNFSEKIYEYLKENFSKEPKEENKPFVVFSDSKTIVIIEDNYVDNVVEKLLKKFQLDEKYEVCSEISEIKKEWQSMKTINKQLDSSITNDNKPKRKRGRPRKNKDEG